MANRPGLSPAEQEVQDYLQQVSAGQAGINPRAQTLARSSGDPIAQRYGQRAVAAQHAQNQQNIEDQAREQERQARLQQVEQERQQREMAARQKEERARQTRAAAASGIATTTDIDTGERTIKRHDDGAPVYKAGPVGPPVQAPVTTSTQLTREDGSVTPARNPLVADDGSAAGTVTGSQQTKPVWQQTFRDDRGRTISEPLKEQVDPKTAERYVEVPDAFGRPQRRVVGTDAKTAELLKLEKDVASLDLRRNSIAQARAQFDPRWQPVKAEYEVAKLEWEKLRDNGIQRQGAEWVRINPETGTTTFLTQEAVAYYQKRSGEAKARFDRAKAAYDAEAPRGENITRAEREANLAALQLKAREIGLKYDLPTDDGGLAMELAGIESGIKTEAGEAAEKAAKEEIPEPRPLTGEDALRKALAPIAGDNLTIEGKEAGQTYIYRDGMGVGKIDARRGPASLILSPQSPADMLGAVATAGEPGGLPTYLADNTRERMAPAEEAGWMANVLSVISNPTQGPLAAGQERVPQADPNAALKAMGASHQEIVDRVKDGRLSVGHGETLLRKLYDDTLKAPDPRSPETFNAWLGEQDSKLRVQWQMAQGKRDRETMGAIQNQFVNDWYASNHWKPGVTFEMQREARGAGLPEKSGWDITKGLAADTGGIVVEAAGSMVGMFSGIVGQAGFTGVGLFNEDAARAAESHRDVFGRAGKNWNRGLAQNYTKDLTGEGKARNGALSQAEFELDNLIQTRHEMPPGDFREKLQAAAKNVGDRAYDLHALNLEDGWAAERADFDIGSDEALRNSLLRYAETGDPEQWKAFRRRLRMDKGQRQAEETMAALTEGQGRLSSAFTAGVMAPPQEMGIEVLSTALTAGTGKLLSTGAKATLEGAEAAATGQRLARLRAAAAGLSEDFAKFGKFTDTVANPASKAQRLFNRAVDVAKVQAVEGAGEAVEEGVSALADPNVTSGSVAEAMRTGFIGSIFLGPLLGGVGAAQNVYRERHERGVQAKKFAEWYNQTNAGTDGFQPMSTADAEAALAMVDPETHQRLAEEHQAALADLATATQEMADSKPVPARGTPSDSGTNAAIGEAWQENAASKFSRATARALETSAALANYIGGVVEAAQSTKAMDAPAKARTLGLMKVASGRTELLTGAERQAITGLQTRDGLPYFADVDGKTVFTAEGRAELLADQPLVGGLVQTDESRALVDASISQPQPTAPDEQDTQGPTEPQSAQEAPQTRQAAGQAPAGPVGPGAVDVQSQGATPTRAVGAQTLADLGGAGAAIVDNFYRGIEQSLSTTSEVPTAERGTRVGKAWSMVRKKYGAGPEVVPRFMAAVRRASSEGDTAQSWARSLSEAFQFTPDDAAKTPAAVPVAESPVLAPAQAAVARAEARYPALKGRFTIDATGERTGSGGAYMQDGQVVINLADAQQDLAGYDGTEQQDARLDAVLGEEIVHIAQLEAVQRAGGSFKETYGQLWEELTPMQQRAAAATYGQEAFDGLETWQKAAESVRMLVQQRVDGRVTELTKAFSKDMPTRLLQLLRSAVEFLREIVTKGEVPPRVRQAIDAIEGMLAEFQGQDRTAEASQPVGESENSSTATQDGASVENENAPMRVVGLAIRDAAAADARLTKNLRRELELATEDLDAVLETLPPEDRRPFFDQAIRGWLDERFPPKTEKGQPAGVRAREILNSGEFPTLSAVFAEGKIAPRPNAISLVLARKRAGQKLTEREMAVLRNTAEWDDAVFQNQFENSGNGRVAREILSLLMAKPGDGIAPDVMASTVEEGATASDLWAKIGTELNQVATGQRAEGTSLDPNREWTDAEIAAEEARRAAMPEPERQAEPSAQDDDEILFSSPAPGAVLTALQHPSFATVPNPDNYQPYEEARAVVREIARENGIQLVRPRDPDSAAERGYFEASGLDIAYFRGARGNGAGFVSRLAPGLIFLNTVQARYSLGWVIAHETVHAAQKDARLGKLPIYRRVSYLLSRQERANLMRSLLEAGYRRDEIITELPAHLLADAAFAEEAFDIGALAKGAEIKAASQEWFASLPPLKPEALDMVADDELVRLDSSPISAAQLAGRKIEGEWNAYGKQSGTLGIPRAEMPQVKADDRSALVQFLRARGVDYAAEDVLPGALRPTQAEYSPAKVRKAREFEGGNRSILASADGYVVDGHHQWMAALADAPKEPMSVIRFDAPIRELLPLVREMPSATTAGGVSETAPVQPDLFEALQKPENAEKAASVKVGTKNALGAYRFLTAKRKKTGKLTADEEQQLLEVEQALGQALAFDMGEIRGSAEKSSTPQAAAGAPQRRSSAPQADMALPGETESNGQLRLFSSPANQTPTRVVGVKVPAGFPDERSTTKELAIWARENVKGAWPSDALAGDVEVTTYGISHTAHQTRRKPAKMRLIPALPDLIKVGRIVTPGDGDIIQLHAIASLDGKPHLARLTVEQRSGDNRGPWNRFYDLKSVEIEDAPAVMSAFPPEEGSLLAEPGRSVTLAQLAEIVKKVEGGDVTLFASPATKDTQAAVDAALAAMPPLQREVFQRISNGATEADVMLRFGLSKLGVTRVLDDARARLAVATQAASPEGLQPAMRDGKIDGGRPDLAYGAQPAMAAIDQARNDSDVPGVRSREEVVARAERMLADDYQGTYDALLQAGADERQLADHEVAAAKIILGREMIDGGAKTKSEQVKLAMLAYSYRDIGTETARALAMRFDPHMKPAERHAQFLAEALTTPDAATRRAMKGKPKAQKEAMLSQWMERVRAIKDELLAQGIDIDASLAAFQQRQQAEKQAQAESPRATAVIDETVKKLTKREKAVVNSVRAGATWDAVAFQTGMEVKEAQGIYRQFYASINEAMAASAKRYLEASLAASPVANAMRSILDDLGVPHPDDIAVDAADQQKRQKEKAEAKRRESDRKSREKKREQALGKPVGKPDITLEEWAGRPPASWRTLYETEMKALRGEDRISFEEWAAKEFPASHREYQRAMDLRSEGQKQAFEDWADSELSTWRGLWQTEMAGLRPQSRVSFEEWAAQPATRDKFQKQGGLFQEPINETTGPSQRKTTIGQGELGLEPELQGGGQYDPANPNPIERELAPWNFGEAIPSGTFDLNDPLAMKQVMDAFAIARGSKLDALMEYWRSSILTGPQTHIVNAGSNLLHVAYDLLPRRGTEALINSLLGLVGQGSDRAATFKEFAPMARQLHKAVQLASRNALRSWKLESRTFEAYARAEAIQLDFTGLGAEYIPPALGGKIGKIMRSLSFRAMTAADEFFKSLYAQFEVAGQSHRIAAVEEKLNGKAYEDRMAELMEPGSKAWLRAIDGAKRVTFQEELDGENPRLINRLDQMAQLLKQGRSAPYIGRPLTLVLPFIDTPLNIFKQAIQMSPLGSFLVVVDGIRSLRRRVMAAAKERGLLKSPKHDPAQLRAEAEAIYDRLRVIQDLTNQTLGWAALFAMQGLVGGGDEDELPVITGTVPYKTTKRGERDNAYAVMPPMTIRIPGTGIQFSYSRIEPFATMLASSADLLVTMNRQGGLKPAVASETLARFKDQVSEKTFLQGLSSLFNAVEDPDRFAERMASNIATGFVPNIIRQPLRESDNVVRDQNPRSDDGFFASVGKRIGYSLVPGKAPAKVDVWGNEVPAARGGQFGGTEATDLFFRILDPTNASFGVKLDPIDRWIFRYNLATAESDKRLSIQPISNAVSVKFPGADKGQMVAITPEEQAEANRNAGKLARSMLGDEWETAPLTEDHADRIKEVVAQAQKAERSRLRMKLLAEGPDARK